MRCDAEPCACESVVGEELSAEDLAAEEAAVAAVGEFADEEADDDADAMDEDADAARPDSRGHPLWNMPPPASDVDVGFAFTSGLDDTAVLVLGQEASAVIGLSNNGKSRYHVWGVQGSLNDDLKFNNYVQNFTYSVVNKTVSPGTELSFGYTFEPNERHDTRSFQLALSVFYEAQGSSGNAIRGHSTTFYNATVATEAGPQTIDNGTFIAIALAVVAAAVGGFFVMKSAADGKAAATPEMGTSTTTQSEWLEDHNSMMKSGGGRRAGASRK